MPTLDEMIRRQREQEEAEVAEAEAKATAAGKERFELAQVEQLLGAEPGSYAEKARRCRQSSARSSTVPGRRTRAAQTSKLVQWPEKYGSSGQP